jgi:MoaA/NifB/PqqE/SkfB family radical SAM enzyme
MLATWHWHIEISSKCTLRCPRCSRQEVPNGLVNTELDLEFIQRNFTSEFIKNNVRKITFCGDDGDPIYAHDLIPVIKYFKSHYPVEFVIITNGSYRSAEWWTELGSALDESDAVHFSIDGYDDRSNNEYRINSDWDSIMLGIQSLRNASLVHITWAAIGFSFNQDHIRHMVEQARSMGVDQFQLTKSTKFFAIYPSYGENDLLQPRKEFVSSSKRFERQYIDISGRSAPGVHLENLKAWDHAQTNIVNDVLPLCAVGNKGLFINSQGHFFPCCWVANRYGHNTEWLDRGRSFNLKERTLASVLHDAFWSSEFQTFNWLECQTKCNKNQVTKEYATSW